jgi:lysophospholipase L1-like esterase
MRIEDGSSILFTGDSVTDAGRAHPVGEDAKGWLGTGYVALIAAIMEAWRPGHRCRIRDTGIGGNTVIELKERWKKDVLDLRPDWLSVMVGINDCGRSFARPMVTEGLVPFETYRSTLDGLVKETRPLLHGMVLMTPFYVDTNLQDGMRAAVDAYGDAVRNIARAYDCVLVDTQAAFDRARNCRPLGCDCS